MKKWIIFLLWQTSYVHADAVLAGPKGIYPVKECLLEDDGIKIIPCFGDSKTCEKKYQKMSHKCHKIFKSCSDTLLSSRLEISKKIGNAASKIELYETQGKIGFVLDKDRLDFTTIAEAKAYVSNNSKKYAATVEVKGDACPPHNEDQ